MDQLQEFKCPCCGGAISFNSQLQKMKCPYCDTEFELSTLTSYEEELNQSVEEPMKWDVSAGGEWKDGEADHLRTYICKSCGGQIIGDESTAATACPFCDNPVVMLGQLSGELKPDLVIPFQLDKEAAKQGLQNHYKGKVLLPKIFKDENHIEEIRGVYVPFWLFDADSHAHIRYKATKEKQWSDSNYYYKETSYYSVTRIGDVSFAHVPVDGSQKMPDDLMESIEPYEYNGAVDFQTAYLAGYIADRYDVTAQQSIDRANERIRHSTESEFRKTVQGYNSVITDFSNIKLENGAIRYALYPVWLLNTKWKEKQYTFAMNGQTGKMVGNLPMDKGRFTMWLMGSFFLSTIVMFLLSYLVTETLGKAVMMGLVLGLIIALIIAFSLKAQLKSVRMQYAASSYIKKIKINVRRDLFLYKKLEKKEKTQNQKK